MPRSLHPHCLVEFMWEVLPPENASLYVWDHLDLVVEGRQACTEHSDSFAGDVVLYIFQPCNSQPAPCDPRRWFCTGIFMLRFHSRNGSRPRTGLWLAQTCKGMEAYCGLMACVRFAQVCMIMNIHEYSIIFMIFHDVVRVVWDVWVLNLLQLPWGLPGMDRGFGWLSGDRDRRSRKPN